MQRENLSIKTWAEEDRPREKLLLKGRHTLSDAELVAILIASGNDEESAVDLAKRILHSINNDLNALAQLSINDLKKFKGIGEAKAISIVAALELGRRRQGSEVRERQQIVTSRDAYEYLQPYLSDLRHEEFWVIFLDRKSKVLACERLSAGGVSGTVADSRMILKSAIEKLSSSMIVAHNHPSGNLQPSQADIALTDKLKAAAKLLDIHLQDHLIIGEQQYYSFADGGRL